MFRDLCVKKFNISQKEDQSKGIFYLFIDKFNNQVQQ